MKKIERTLHVTIVARDGALKLIGPEAMIKRAKSVFNNLVELSKRGNAITEQNVDYALSLAFTESDDVIPELSRYWLPYSYRKTGKAENHGTKAVCGYHPEKDDCLWYWTGRHRKNLSGYGYGDFCI